MSNHNKLLLYSPKSIAFIHLAIENTWKGEALEKKLGSNSSRVPIDARGDITHTTLSW